MEQTQILQIMQTQLKKQDESTKATLVLNIHRPYPVDK